MKDSPFYEQVVLLLRVLPLVAAEKCFALKGGTALNLFVREMPRLSVDIDLTFLPITDRKTSLTEIGNAMLRIKERIENAFPDLRVVTVQVSGTGVPTSMTIESAGARIRVEVNFVLRGSVFEAKVLSLCKSAQKEFGFFSEIQSLSIADLYGGKLCAALDRQHPRDLFDVKVLLDNEGITEEMRKAFLVYLASHSRPMNELLAPRWKNLDEIFKRDFDGMTTDPISIGELIEARDAMLLQLQQAITPEEKRFLLSLKDGSPDWGSIGIAGVEKLPGVQWKLSNIRKMSAKKRTDDLEKLKRALGV